MDLDRVLRHLLCMPVRLRRAFPPQTQRAISEAIKAAERAHEGEIRFAVEATLPPALLLRGCTPRDRAIEVFSALRVWDTERNCGVLIYVLLADHAVEVVADRGILARADASTWTGICRRVEAAFTRGDYQAGAVSAIEAVAETLGRHIPPRRRAGNELSDQVELLD
jgi:uncharacterized membrane protein